MNPAYRVELSSEGVYRIDRADGSPLTREDAVFLVRLAEALAFDYSMPPAGGIDGIWRAGYAAGVQAVKERARSEGGG